MDSEEVMERSYLGAAPVRIVISDSTNVMIKVIVEGGDRPAVRVEGIGDICGLARDGSSGRLSEG